MTENELYILIERYGNRGLIVDSNLLVLLMAGHAMDGKIDKIKRAKHYTSEDFILLDAVVSKFSSIFTTPSILTEVSNLLGQSPDYIREKLFLEYAKQVLLLKESYRPTNEVSQDESFLRFGLTDVAIYFCAKKRIPVITDDLPLYVMLLNKGLLAINFTNLRPLGWSH